MTFEPNSTSQRNGAIVVSVISLLSVFALVFIAVRTVRLAAMFLNRGDPPSRPLLFFRTRLGHYSAYLTLSNVFISTSGLINLGWVSHSGLSRGSVCVAQAVLMQIGIWSGGWFTATHAMHTLLSLVFRIRPANWQIIAIISTGWTIAFVSALAPLQKSDFYGPAGISCGITRLNTVETFVLGALPIILGAFVSIAVYTVVLLTLHGKLRTSKTRDPTSNNRRADEFEDHHRFLVPIVRTLLWYSLAYALLLSPFCIKHIVMFAGHSVSPAFGAFTDACASLLGLVNVGLLFNTMRLIQPIRHKPAQDAEKTFGNDASGESPLDLKPKSRWSTQTWLPTYKSSHLTFIPAKSFPSHFASTANSSTKLLPANRASYEFRKAKVAPLVLNNIMPPGEFSRQLEENVETGQDPQSKMVIDLPSGTVVPPPCPLQVAFVTRDATHESCIQDKRFGSQMLVPTDTFGIKVPTRRSRAPPTQDISIHHRPDVAPRTPDKENVGIAASFPNAEGGTKSGSSSPFRASTATDMMQCDPDDRDPDDLGEIVYAYEVAPHVQGPASATARHISRATVWSQESGHTMSRASDLYASESRPFSSAYACGRTL